jgi:hypothetical protein
MALHDKMTRTMKKRRLNCGRRNWRQWWAKAKVLRRNDSYDSSGTFYEESAQKLFYHDKNMDDSTSLMPIFKIVPSLFCSNPIDV